MIRLVYSIILICMLAGCMYKQPEQKPYGILVQEKPVDEEIGFVQRMEYFIDDAGIVTGWAFDSSFQDMKVVPGMHRIENHPDGYFILINVEEGKKYYFQAKVFEGRDLAGEKDLAGENIEVDEKYIKYVITKIEPIEGYWPKMSERVGAP